MSTETQVVKRFVALLRKHPEKYRGWASRYLSWHIHQELVRGDLRGGFVLFGHDYPDRAYMARRLEKRIRKKAAQPFRRKKRGPMRAKAAGKNEVTRRR